ncbi:MAG: FxsA family protein [Firmicutes bacterium]|nr:FxsA family protein [Bacillota bacterium]
MLIKLLLLFILVLVTELFLLIKLGQSLGVLPTALLVMATGFAGIILARAQGLIVLTNVISALRRGEMPTEAILNGLLVLIGAALLLTPGLITDSIGFLLLLPVTRKPAKIFFYRKLKKALEEGTLRFFRR